MRRVCIRQERRRYLRYTQANRRTSQTHLLLATLPDPRFALLTSLVPERNSDAKDWAVMTPWGAREQNRTPEL